MKYVAYTSAKESGDLVRSETLLSIVSEWKRDALSFVIGQGYTKTFYNVGRMAWTYNVELSYWNLLRQVGLFCFIFIIYCYTKPIISMLRHKGNYPIILSYAAYLIGCYVNPLLYSSTGVTAMLFAYCYAYINVPRLKNERDRYSIRGNKL